MSSSDDGRRGDAGQGRRFNFNTGFGIFFVALSVWLAIIIPSQIEKPLIVLPSNEGDLEPTLFPYLVAAGFFVLGIWLILKSFSLTERNHLRELDRRAIANVTVTLAAMAAYGPLMMTLGFVVSSAIVIAFLSTFFGNRNFLLTAAVSIGVPVAIFYVFTHLLVTYLPPFPIDTPLTRLNLL
ncbi:MAG TPA: tripartite tricarboxylate transporter TctB family protein [Kiloniellales bacterium]|nr:tripartite tricarboxylate transporter TctB family protein [Kiloniellales bacterium]